MKEKKIITQYAAGESVFKESDFFTPGPEKRERKYVIAQAKAIALVLLLALIVSGAAALIVTSLADSYSKAHNNTAVVTVKYKDKQTNDKSLIGTSVNGFWQ